MNWEAIQAVAESVGAVGVIGSLAYLAAQVRHNTRALHATANQDLVTSYNQLLEFAKTEYGAGIYHGVFTGPAPDWTVTEFTAERTLVDQGLRVFEQAYLQQRAGMLQEQVWQGWEETIRLAANVPAVLRYWTQLRTQLSPGFVSFIEGCQTDHADASAEFFAERLELMTPSESEQPE
jgi:hypothetical protein